MGAGPWRTNNSLCSRVASWEILLILSAERIFTEFVVGGALFLLPVLGVNPLMPDVFWIGLAITLMAGLSFGMLITMFLVSVIDVLLYRAKPESTAET